MSKLILFEFECNHCGTLFEDLVQPTEHETPCTECGFTANRCISTGHLGYRIMGADPTLPTAALKWEKMQRHKTKTDKGGLKDGAPNLKMY